MMDKVVDAVCNVVKYNFEICFANLGRGGALPRGEFRRPG